MIAVGLTHLLQCDGALSAAGRLREADFDGGFGVLRRREAFDACQLFDAFLGLGGFAGFGAEAVDEVLEVGDLALLIFVSGGVLLLAGFFFGEVVLVVAAVEVKFGAGDFDDADADGVEKCAVVGDDEDGAAIIREVILEPAESFKIEVVGRFVEHEEVRLHHQQACQVGAHDPAAAHGAGGAMMIALAEGQTSQDPLGFGFEVVAVQLDKTRHGLVMLGAFLIGKITQQFVHLGHFFADGCGQLQNGLLSGGGAFLRQEAQSSSALQVDASGVRFVVPQDKGKKCGFSGAVGTDEADAITGVDLQGRLFEQEPAAEGFTDLGYGKHEEL